MNNKNRLCPICNSKKNKIIKKFNFALIDSHPIKNGYDLVCCENCNFVFANILINQEVIDDYYKNLSKYESKQISSGGNTSKNDIDRFSKTAEYIKNNFSNNKIRILDLGCANGGLLFELKKLGFENIVGIDPSSQCVQNVKNDHLCEAFNYSLFDIDFSKVGIFDLVIISHVWETCFRHKKSHANFAKFIKRRRICLY